MSSFRRFEEIIAWQKARVLFTLLINTTETSPLKNDFPLRNQMERSCGSVMDNIAEGFGRMGNGEFVHFLTISIGSAREFQSQLYRCLDKKHFTETVFEELYNLCEEIGRMLPALIIQLKKSDIKGLKFK